MKSVKIKFNGETHTIPQDDLEWFISEKGATVVGDVDPGNEQPKLNAKERAKIVSAAETIEELDLLIEGEEAKTVLDAADKRRSELEG